MFRFFLFLCFSAFLHAACNCLCVDGEMQAVCANSYDIEPVCPARTCPIAPYSVPPLQTPMIPPPGKTDCHQAQIYNESTHRYEWSNICE